MKFLSLIFCGFCCVLFLAAGVELFVQNGWSGILYLPAAMFPHFFFYGFAGLIVLRCIWRAWSERVFRRICCVAYGMTVIGVFMEYYWNPVILETFSKLLKIFYDLHNKILCS